jgi:hypothetical protein
MLIIFSILLKITYLSYIQNKVKIIIMRFQKIKKSKSLGHFFCRYVSNEYKLNIQIENVLCSDNRWVDDMQFRIGV